MIINIIMYFTSKSLLDESLSSAISEIRSTEILPIPLYKYNVKFSIIQLTIKFYTSNLVLVESLSSDIPEFCS